eukprot:s2127_g18.t1
MPSGSDGSLGTEVSEMTGGPISSQLASLVPSFDPSKDDLQLYQQKVQLVLSVWSSSKISELVTRLILNSSGSAFAKLQLHQTELCINDAKAVKQLIELLGGHWGKTSLEERYLDAERALYQCSQQNDESHDSFLARADILWTRLMTQKLQLEDLQAYVTLRGASLTSEDKKRVIIDSDNSLEGKLTMVKVRESIRMLGTSFFQEMVGGKKTAKAKVYDSTAMTVEDCEQYGDHDDDAHVAHDDYAEDEFIENLAHAGDEDAVMVADYENAVTELIQSDEDLSAAYTSYVEARRKLGEKYRARGFWPISNKGKGKSFKGRTKGRPAWGRKTLQQTGYAAAKAIGNLSAPKGGAWHHQHLGQRPQNSHQHALALTLKAVLVITKTPRRPATMSDWAQRLQRLQADAPAPELESIEHYTLEMLKGETVKFGKAHWGKSYEEVWMTSPSWVKWFLLHYQGSSHLEHRKVIKYIKMKIEEGETLGPIHGQAPIMPKSKAAPKSLATAAKARPMPQPEASQGASSMGIAEPWVEQPESAVMMGHL